MKDSQILQKKDNNYLAEPSFEQRRNNGRRDSEYLDEQNLESQLENIIIQLKKEFNIKDLNDYQNLLLIIYNSLFLQEDSLDSNIKYKIFSLLDCTIEKIEDYKKQLKYSDKMDCKSNSQRNNIKDNEFLINDIFKSIVPYYMQNGLNLITQQRGRING